MSVDVTFDHRGLVPAVLQHAETGEVLMVAWMNREALRLTQETGQAHFWSRSREKLWHKGATSGNVMHVRDIWLDCDGDTLLVRVDPAGPACHTGERSCFYRCLNPGAGRAGDVSPPVALGERAPLPAGGHEPQAARSGGTAERSILDELFDVIVDRKAQRPSRSYTTALFEAGEDEILKKVGEEAMEIVLAAKGEGDERVVSEAADLVYHLLVLLASRDLELADVEAELERRRR